MMTNISNTIDIKNRMSIIDLLSHLGFKQTKKIGSEIFYQNVFRESKRSTKNSFYLNDELGVWFDKGLGKGGDIIDFGLAYWRNLSLEEVLEKISELCSKKIPNETVLHGSSRRRKAVKIPNYHIQEVRAIGSNSQVCSYLRAETILDISNIHIKEVYYYVTDEKGVRKDFCSAGWQNENGGWEVRSWYYSGCIGRRGISFISGEENSLVVFENFKDYLLWQDKIKVSGPNILVLNSFDFLNAAIHRASKFNQVSAFLATEESNINFLTEVKKIKSKLTH